MSIDQRKRLPKLKSVRVSKSDMESLLESRLEKMNPKKGGAQKIALPKKDVDLRNCKKLKELPRNFNPKGDVLLHWCKNLRKLPSNFNPGGNVYLAGCNKLKRLPRNFNPKGDIYISKQMKIKIPERLS